MANFTPPKRNNSFTNQFLAIKNPMVAIYKSNSQQLLVLMQSMIQKILQIESNLL